MPKVTDVDVLIAGHMILDFLKNDGYTPLQIRRVADVLYDGSIEKVVEY